MDLGEGHTRDLLIAVAVVGGILLALYLYTGTWPPPVVVESNSMMHVDKAEYQQNFGTTRAEDVPYGRWGTIDPGDLVLVKNVEKAEEIETFANGGDEHYGDPGEVVIYFKRASKIGTPIIHRAMTYVDVSGSGSTKTYDVRWSSTWDDSDARSCREDDGTRICTFGSDGVTIPSLGLQGADFSNDGFITKGDNAAGNPGADQAIGIYDRPVPIENVQGVARGELPWFGLIKLTLTGDLRNTQDVRDHPYYMTFGAMTAPEDLWVMLVVGLTVVVVAPIGVDYGIHYGRRWLELQGRPSDDEPPGLATGGDDPPPPDDGTPPREPSPSEEPSAEAATEDEEPPAQREDDKIEISLD